MILNLEDCLEHLAGLRDSPVKFTIEKTDHTIITSIARQCFKGIALTDRQSALMHEKLQTYRDQFINLDWDFDYAVNQLRQPLRHIDRRKYIKLVEVKEQYYIKVRFPFSKSLIIEVQSVGCPAHEHLHEKGSHEHLFLLNEKNVYEIVTRLKDKNFEIDQEVLDYYAKVEKFVDQETYDSSIINFEFNNVHPRAVELALSELGAPSADNIVKYRDRKRVYGINYFDENLDIEMSKQSVLTQNIVKRTHRTFFIKSTEWNFDNVITMLTDLDRFPLVIMLSEETAYDQLTMTHSRFRNLFDHTQISVNFRLQSAKNNGFNEYIRDHQLNSPVDKNTKVVYTSTDKLNKPLLISECKPRTALMLESHRVHTKIGIWLDEFDLVIHHDKEQSQFMRFMNIAQGIY